MEKAFRDVLDFHVKACGPLSEFPPELTLVSDATERLRLRLIDEEYKELIDAICCDDTAQIADACADLIYVAIGTAIAYGIDLPRVWDAVHSSNMAKIAKGVQRDVTGKVMKGSGWKHPDISEILCGQKPLSEIYGAAK